MLPHITFQYTYYRYKESNVKNYNPKTPKSKHTGAFFFLNSWNTGKAV